MHINCIWPLCLCAGLYSGTYAFLTITILLHALPIWIVKKNKQRKVRRLESQWPGFLKQLSSLLQSGQGVSQSISRLSQKIRPPLSKEIALINTQMKMGKTLQECFNDIEVKYPGLGVRSISISIETCLTTGAPLSPLLEQLAQSLQIQQSMKNRVMSLTAQGRMQAYSCLALPLLVFASISIISPGYFDFFFENFAGRLLFLACLISLGLGFLFVQKLSVLNIKS
ncbi:MAG: type II secretion system F family protein [Bdellovibrionales bacterium]|nr:type II secretion system F family protein [Bdellovibrionales bacterium]